MAYKAENIKYKNSQNPYARRERERVKSGSCGFAIRTATLPPSIYF